MGGFKNFLASPRKKSIAEHFCYWNTLPLLIKIKKLQISFKLSGSVLTGQRCSKLFFLCEA